MFMKPKTLYSSDLKLV